MSDDHNIHEEIDVVFERWGAGGLLAELERIEARHGQLPERVAELSHQLARTIPDYAYSASLSHAGTFRDTPCEMCARVAQTAREASEGEVAGDG